MSRLWKEEEDKLVKSGRKWAESKSWMPYRCAELFCECCGKSLGEHDIVCTNLQTNMYCSKCVKQYIPSIPFNIPYSLAPGIEVTSDSGSFVCVRYTDGITYDEMVVAKDCYFNSKGRFIKVKGKRYYLNLMPLLDKKESYNGEQ